MKISIKGMRVLLLVALCFLLIPGAALATNYYVKTPANGGSDSNDGLGWDTALATIGAAMAKVDGQDNVYVAAGEYYEKVTFDDSDLNGLFGGYAAAGGGTSDPWNNLTIIDGSTSANTGAVVTIPYAPDHMGYFGIIIDGFTIRNGTDTSGGGAGGIQSFALTVNIRNCIVENNTSNGYAGGVHISCGHLTNGTPIIEKCIIRNNSSPGVGGIQFEGAGAKTSNYSAKLYNTLVYGNSSTGNNPLGIGGIYIFYPAAVNIYYCTIADNVVTGSPTTPVPGIAVSGYGAPDYDIGQAIIMDSIIWHTGGDDLYVDSDGGYHEISYSDIEDSGDTGTGVIHTNPAFVGSGDYHLTAGSGDCIDGGVEISGMTDDLEGTSRPQGSGYDMGAYEYIPYPDITVTDNKGTTYDLLVPFGGVTEFETADATVTITNDGTLNLVIGTIGTINPLAAPFSIDASACSGKTLEPEESCNCTVTFAPEATGDFSDSFDIPSNDPDEGTVTVSVSGNGLSATVQHTLKIEKTGDGTVTPDVGEHDYDEGTVVDLTAVADDKWMFDGWSGDVADTDAATTTTTMNADKTVTAVFVADDDNDGVSTEEEQGPDGSVLDYDGNGDGTPDSQQNNVVSGHTYDGTYYVTLAVSEPAGAALKNVASTDNPSPSDSPANVTFTYGFFDFTVTGANAPPNETLVTLYLPTGATPDTYWKYGPKTLGGPDVWYEFLYDGTPGTSGAEFNGNVITLHFVDGQRGDDDLTVNGEIVDVGAPGTTASPPPSQPSGGGGGGGGCFITSSAF